MIYQVSTTDWILGLGIMFGLSLLFTFLTFRNLSSFLLYLTMFCAFAFWGGLIESWVLIACFIMDLIIFLFELRSGGGQNIQISK